MEVIPVIDLGGGQVVHARAGKRREYRPIATPLAASSAVQDVVAGLLGLFPFRRLYVADLDAIEGVGGHDAVIGALAAAHPELGVWLDNGTADASSADAWLAHHRGRLVIGSETQSGTETLRALQDEPRVVLSLDFRGDDFLGPQAILDDPSLWPATVIVMTLAQVGSGLGPDFERIRKTIGRAGHRAVYAAGGVRNGRDVELLAAAGAAGVLIATALHAGAIGPAELASLTWPPLESE